MSKKFSAIFLSLVLLITCAFPALATESSSDSDTYKRVVIIGVDGAGGFFKEAETPNFDKIFANGAVKYNARAEFITISAQNWGAMLNGVSYLKHGLTNEILTDETRDSSCDYPTIFTYVRKAMPNAELASFASWSPINTGLIETDINVTKYEVGNDLLLTDEICKYFDDGNDPALLFIDYDSVDAFGHEYGCKAPEYLNQISVIDSYIGRVYDAIVRNNKLDDTLILLVADHGEAVWGGHGGRTLDESRVVMAAAGKSVVSGGSFDCLTRNRDIAAITLHALGVEIPSHMTSRVPNGLFTDVNNEPDLGIFSKIVDFFNKLFESVGIRISVNSL